MIYLVPSVLDLAASKTIPPSVLEAIMNCEVIFAENERTTRRYLKSLDKEIIIDNFEWFTIHNAEAEQAIHFKQRIKEQKNIAIISEAGCPGIADPGQKLIKIAHQLNVQVKPLVGPSSILLSLMASGMNGQHFQFVGYLPIDSHGRTMRIKELEEESSRKKCTQVFIETPYRNNQLIETVLKNCRPSTQFCIACDLTALSEFIRTKSITDWRNEKIDLHKRPAIFLLEA